MACDTVHRLAVPCALQTSAGQAAAPATRRHIGLKTWILGVLATLREAHLRRLSIQELSRLRDQDLRDIGTSRDEIEATVDRLMQLARVRRR